MEFFTLIRRFQAQFRMTDHIALWFLILPSLELVGWASGRIRMMLPYGLCFCLTWMNIVGLT